MAPGHRLTSVILQKAIASELSVPEGEVTMQSFNVTGKSYPDNKVFSPLSFSSLLGNSQVLSTSYQQQSSDTNPCLIHFTLLSSALKYVHIFVPSHFREKAVDYLVLCENCRT